MVFNDSVGNDLPEDSFEEFINRFEASIPLPKDRPQKSYLLAAVGLIGSGKSTVMAPLAERLGLAVITTDDVRKLLRDEGFNYRCAREIATEVDRRLVLKGYSIAIDANSGSKRGAEITAAHSLKLQIPVAWVHVTAPEEVIIERLRATKKNWLFGDGQYAVEEYLRNKEFNKDMPGVHFPFLYTFDTSRNDLDKQIVEAAAVIQKTVDADAIPMWP